MKVEAVEAWAVIPHEVLDTVDDRGLEHMERIAVLYDSHDVVGLLMWQQLVQ